MFPNNTPISKQPSRLSRQTEIPDPLYKDPAFVVWLGLQQNSQPATFCLRLLSRRQVQLSLDLPAQPPGVSQGAYGGLHSICRGRLSFLPCIGPPPSLALQSKASCPPQRP